jgi:hypothetical protein
MSAKVVEADAGIHSLAISVAVRYTLVPCEIVILIGLHLSLLRAGVFMVCISFDHSHRLPIPS